MGKLDGKAALVTGGTSGIGRASAELFAKENARVVFIGRNEEKGKLVEKEIRSRGGYADYYKCDVTSREEVSELRNYIEKEYGKLDILFNNAGVLFTGALEELTEGEWDKTYEVNLKSVVFMCKSMIGLVQKGNGGVILNNTSINGLHHYIKGKRSYMYATSKSALIQFTTYLAKNYAPNVRVNALCPGMTETNLFTNRDFSRFNDCNLLGRMAQPEEIAKVALFLVSDDSSFITGSVIVADGGETIK